MNLPDLNSIVLSIFFFLPGFVSLKIWSLFHGRKTPPQHALIYDSLFFSIVNFALLSPIAVPFVAYRWYNVHPFLLVLFILLYCLAAPAFWPFLWQFLINKKSLYRFFQLPYPTAWDYFFHQRKSCFVLIHLKDDNMVGGYYGPNSYVSTSPDEGSIYLEKVYKIRPDGTFGEQIHDSYGLVIFKEDFNYIELFYEVTE